MNQTMGHIVDMLDAFIGGPNKNELLLTQEEIEALLNGMLSEDEKRRAKIRESIKDASEEDQIEMVLFYPDAVRLIENPTERVIAAASLGRM